MPATENRRGVFPGSFNPLTVAHLEVARQAREQHSLDEVHLVVSKVALDKPTPPGPSFDDRIALIEADAEAFDWLSVVTTELQLIADIAVGYDVVIMGADKWRQVNDEQYYQSSSDRDAAIARLPTVVVATRSGDDAPDGLRLETGIEFHGVSSTEAREGKPGLMAPHAAENWRQEPDV